MAKTIKFNLICDGKPIRTIEDLQNNFSIEDVLSYYNNKLLHRWLTVRGYNKELEEISKITCEKPIEIIKKLITIFSVACDEKIIEKSIYILEYLDERKKLCEIYEKRNYKTHRIIEDYKNKYGQLATNILNNPRDITKIKSNIAEMVSDYSWILKLNHRNLFNVLMNKSHLAIMCLLMNENSRNYYLPIKTIREDGTASIDTNTNKDKKAMYIEICNLISSAQFQRSLGYDLHSFSGITDGYWKDLEPKGKKYMILSIDEGDFVRSSGKSYECLDHNDILNKFIIVDGIDYKSNSLTNKLLYMEV